MRVSSLYRLAGNAGELAPYRNPSARSVLQVQKVYFFLRAWVCLNNKAHCCMFSFMLIIVIFPSDVKIGGAFFFRRQFVRHSGQFLKQRGAVGKTEAPQEALSVAGKWRNTIQWAAPKPVGTDLGNHNQKNIGRGLVIWLPAEKKPLGDQTFWNMLLLNFYHFFGYPVLSRTDIWVKATFTKSLFTIRCLMF